MTKKSHLTPHVLHNIRLFNVHIQTHKKRDLWIVFPLYYKTKSGTAILLFRFSRLWYCPQFRTNNTEAHAVCIFVRAYARTINNTYLMDILCCNVLEFMNLPDSEKPKQSA